MIGRLVISVALCWAALASSAMSAVGKSTSLDKLLKDSKLLAKLDAGLRAKLRSLRDQGAYEQRIDVILKMHRDLSESDVRRLRHKGIYIQSTVGEVITASAPATRVFDLAKNGKIARIELAHTMPLNPPKP